MTNDLSRAPAAPPGIDIRPARESDTRDVAELWAVAFPGKRSVEDRVRMLESGGRYGGLETVLVARTGDGAGEGRATEARASEGRGSEGRGSEGRLAGACKIYRLESHIAGVSMPTMGLAAVAVAPVHRRRGLGVYLCSRAMETAAARGDVLSLLYPFRPDYYERLGWGLVGELHEHRFHTDALPTYAEAEHVRSATGDADGAAIAATYSRVAARSNGPIARDLRVWAYRLAAEELGVRPLKTLETQDGSWPAPSNPGLHAVVFDDGGITGYALLRQVRRTAAGEDILQVRELVAETERAYRGLLGYIAGLAAQWPRARHFARPEERFGDRLSEPRPPGLPAARSLYFPVARVVRGPMLRVLDVPGALGMRRWFDAETGSIRNSTGFGKSLSISVDDTRLPGNRGPWIVRLGEGAVERASGASADAGLSTDPATFARIFAGEIPASAAARLGRAEINGDMELLDRAFATRERFWLLDEF